MTGIEEIADDIYSDKKTRSYADLIGNFEKYQKDLNTIDYNVTAESYDIYSQLIADYGIALAETQRYKKALPIIEKALNLFRNNKKYTATDLIELKFYETLIFNRGLSHYYLGKYNLARPDFELLIKLYPENDIYPKWANSIGSRKLNRVKNILWYFVAGALLVESFFHKTTLIKDVTLGLGLLALIGAIVLETIMYYQKKKYEL
jgi:tetratricopeptide (TPR) repeat protein